MRSLIGTTALDTGLLLSTSAAGWWAVHALRGGSGPLAGRAAARARVATWGGLIAAFLACLMLVGALATHDFSIAYVAENGSRAIPFYYTLISLWAALPGSLLLWLLILTGLTVAVMVRPHPGDAAALQPWALSTMSLVAAFFFGLARFGADPFVRVFPVPVNGPGPNPLLQDNPLMGLHPPLLYLGYVGMTVPFAYAVAALITGRTGRVWLSLTRSWTLLAWGALTVGILMGGWWSYEVLGWGGYWAWDPVENAAILPWFTATALLHSMLVQGRRATLRLWNLALAMGTFLLVLIGTFLTRSGVVESVHAFTQSQLGPILLGFIVVVFLASGALFVWRADRLGADDGLGPVLSRESLFLANNVVLVVLAGTVLLGTVFPLLVEVTSGARVSVGAPYFDRIAVPLSLLLLLLMGVGPLLPWGFARPRTVARRIALPGAVGMTIVISLGLTRPGHPAALLAFGLGGFVLTAIIVQIGIAAGRARRRDRLATVTAVWRTLRGRRRFYGGMLVHVGFVLAAVAIAGSASYAVSGQRQLHVGQSVTAGVYRARLVSITSDTSLRRSSIVATLKLSSGGRTLGTYAPRLSNYPNATESIGTPSVRTSLTSDAYLSLVQVDPGRRWAIVRLAEKPMMLWLWVSAGVMAAGAFLAGIPDHRRRLVRPPVDPVSNRGLLAEVNE